MGSCVSSAKRVDPLRATEPIGPAEICEQTCEGGSPATPLTGTPDTSGESITLGDFAQLGRGSDARARRHIVAALGSGSPQPAGAGANQRTLSEDQRVQRARQLQQQRRAVWQLAKAGTSQPSLPPLADSRGLVLPPIHAPVEAAAAQQRRRGRSTPGPERFAEPSLEGRSGTQQRVLHAAIDRRARPEEEQLSRNVRRPEVATTARGPRGSADETGFTSAAPAP
jgi:hypothetical protein